MRKGIFLSVLILSVALLLLSCESVKETQRTIPPEVALVVESKPAYEDLEMKEKEVKAEEEIEVEKELKAEEEIEVEKELEAEEEIEVEKELEAEEEDILIRHDDAGVHYSLGLAFGKEGKYKEAIEAYNQAIKIKPDYAEAHYNLGISYVMLDDRDSAFKEYKILKELDPQMANKLSNMAIQKASTDKDNKYIIQVGAFSNIDNAYRLIEKLKADYLYVYIEKEDNLNKVRILGIKTK